MITLSEKKPKTSCDHCKRLYVQRHPDRRLASQTKYRVANRDKIRATGRAYAAANRERTKAYNATRYLDNRDRINAQSSVWKKLNRSAVAAMSHRRRMRLISSGGDFTAEQWDALIVAHENRCAYCGAEGVLMTVDHMLPVSRGGRNDITNVIPACQPCNSRKHTMTYEEFVRLEY